MSLLQLELVFQPILRKTKWLTHITYCVSNLFYVTFFINNGLLMTAVKIMGSLFIVISVPSVEHEKTLWMERNFRADPKDLFSKTLLDSCRDSDSEKSNLIVRSVSDTSIPEKVNLISEDTKRKKHYRSFTMQKYKDCLPMEKRLEKCLKELKVPNAVWVLGRAGKYYQISFCAPDGEQGERIIQLLSEHNIGSELNSTVSILPCTLNYEGKLNDSTPNPASPSIRPPSHKCVHHAKESAWELFVNSVRARMMVAQVVAGVKSNATLTFDFLILLIVASVTAAVGLVENSVVILVASMLISPLMGPVMASTFGFATKDWKLQKIGLLNEMLGLLLCVLIGFLCGLLVGYWHWESPDFTWPTGKMLSSGNSRALVVGGLIALLSGAAVAIAVLGNYSGSLTGVAISASLMPPAVNAGLLWAVAVTYVAQGDTNLNKITAFKSGDPLIELVSLGIFSLTLTFINIICIFLMGIFVLKIKEVTPRGSKDYSRLLWKETIQIARDQKYNLYKSPEKMEEGTPVNKVPDLFSEHPYKINMNTWSAYGAIHQLGRPTVQNLAAVWNQYTLNPLSSTGYRPNRSDARFKGTPILYPSLSRIWNVTTPNSWKSVDQLNTAFVCSTGTPSQAEFKTPRRFVVTPTDLNNISKC